MNPFAANYRFLAVYNRWINERLYAASEKLTDAQRKADRGAFFRSIHGTFNHLVWADKLWLKRFAAQGVEFASLTPELLALPAHAKHATLLHEDWQALKDMRHRLDDAIVLWVDAMPEDFPERTMRYANTQGIEREHPMWMALTHFFNHETHHRGQVSTLLMQAGVDPGVTDLLAMAPPK
ncbi:MAG TPA: DinB family protein [Ramlibacter sp.]|uniref:DinB family protein n=1 Tax=Ramlibacter sp. TaxID=1917967 RepID=UPI002C803DCD|nr:DinB family protein [Ramlibacter sp.]HVZ42175.1 DinB family protein [Ramlibacter sp.]